MFRSTILLAACAVTTAFSPIPMMGASKRPSNWCVLTSSSHLSVAGAGAVSRRGPVMQRGKIAATAEASESVPFLNKPEKLDSSLVGYVGFDPIGFSNSFDSSWLAVPPSRYIVSSSDKTIYLRVDSSNAGGGDQERPHCYARCARAPCPGILHFPAAHRCCLPRC